MERELLSTHDRVVVSPVESRAGIIRANERREESMVAESEHAMPEEREKDRKREREREGGIGSGRSERSGAELVTTG